MSEEKTGEGRVSGRNATRASFTRRRTPGSRAVHDGRVIAAARLTHSEDGASGTRVSIDFPADIMSDGVQVVSLRSTVTGAVLDRVTFLAGHILDDDIRAEITPAPRRAGDAETRVPAACSARNPG